MQRFPALKIAYDACRTGGCTPAILNAANEVAVEAFLDGRLKFPQIPEVVAETIDRMDYTEDKDFGSILNVDTLAREVAAAVVLDAKGAPVTDVRSAESR
jgi:1-deoxy-D-xylulose-5-phosphate reductoisomerase